MDTKRIARALAAAPVGASLLTHSGPLFSLVALFVSGKLVEGR